MTPRFDGLRYLTVADDLARHGGQEYDRSATNRAYYAVFCSIRDRLQDRGYWFSGGRSVHQEVVNALRHDGRPQIKHMAFQLARLFRVRARADYDTGVDYPARKARRAITWASRISQRIPPALTALGTVGNYPYTFTSRALRMPGIRWMAVSAAGGMGEDEIEALRARGAV